MQEATHKGFGRRIIEQMIAQQEGNTHFDWRREGVVCEITLPVGVLTSTKRPNGQSVCRRVLLLANSVEKVGVSTRPIFFSAVGAVFRCGRRRPHHPPLLLIDLWRQLTAIEDVIGILADSQRLQQNRPFFDISLQCNDLLLSGAKRTLASGLLGRIYEFTHSSSKPNHPPAR